MKFSLDDLFLVLGVGQGLFLSFSIPAKLKYSNGANRILLAIIIMATIMMAGKVVVHQYLSVLTMKVAAVVDTAIFLFGPLILLYVQRILRQSSTRYFLHFVPATIHMTYALVLMAVPQQGFVGLFKQMWFLVLISAIETFGLISLIAYSIISWLQLRKEQSLDESAKFVSRKALFKYLHYFHLSVGVLISFWLVSYIGLYIFRQSFSFFTYRSMWMITPAFFYVVGFFSIRQPELFTINPKYIPSKVDRLDPKEISLLSKKLDQAIGQQLYKQPDLTMKTLADHLETKPNDLSWLLNNVYGKSFYDFINEVRIEAFKEKLKNNEHNHLTILGIAMDVGFKSKSTFNRAFKTISSETPKEYLERMRSS
ncbi:MAG: helix-turn-helix transcriptional regulator [Cyclobacteriaceae bacterium]|nr:helix-turn-helix transcriptional regulator [Cyclobacteriaceae bacterium HetDA_MAG_MS6]